MKHFLNWHGMGYSKVYQEAECTHITLFYRNIGVTVDADLICEMAIPCHFMNKTRIVG